MARTGERYGCHTDSESAAVPQPSHRVDMCCLSHTLPFPHVPRVAHGRGMEWFCLHGKAFSEKCRERGFLPWGASLQERGPRCEPRDSWKAKGEQGDCRPSGTFQAWRRGHDRLAVTTTVTCADCVAPSPGDALCSPVGWPPPQPTPVRPRSVATHTRSPRTLAHEEEGVKEKSSWDVTVKNVKEKNLPPNKCP